MGWIPDPGGSDDDAIHDNVAGEIAAVTEKATPVSADLVLIEDSADSNNKKKAQLGNLPGGGGGGGGRTLLDSDTLASDGTISITGISGSHTDLLLVLDARSTASGIAGDSFRLRMGGSGGIDTGNNYSYAWREDGSTSNSAAGGDTSAIGPTSGFGGPLTAGNAGADIFGNAEITFVRYTDTTEGRHILIRGGRRAASGNIRVMYGYGHWENEADAVEEIEVRAGSTTNIEAGSRWWLYGID